MNKSELVHALSEKTGYRAKDCEAFTNAFVEVVKETVKSGDFVRLIGFGTFDSLQRKATECTNPQTGKKIKVAARKVPRFKAGKAFKDAVNSKSKAKSKKK